MFGISEIFILRVLLILVALFLWIIALKKLKNNGIDNISKILWAAFITWTPFFGPICYLIVCPKKENSQ